MVLELPSYKWPSLTQRALHRARSGPGVSQDRGHDHLRDLRRDVVAERVSAQSRRQRRPWRCARRRQRPASRADRAQRSTARGRRARGATRGRRGSFAGRIGRFVAAGLRAARLRLAADRRHAHELRRTRGLRVDDVRAGRRGHDDASDAGVIERIRTMTRDDGTPVFTRATVGERARVLRARDAVPGDADGDPARDRRPAIRGAFSSRTCSDWPMSRR